MVVVIAVASHIDDAVGGEGWPSHSKLFDKSNFPKFSSKASICRVLAGMRMTGASKST